MRCVCWGVGDVTAKKVQGFFWGNDNVLQLNVAMVAHLCKYTKKHGIVNC